MVEIATAAIAAAALVGCGPAGKMDGEGASFAQERSEWSAAEQPIIAEEVPWVSIDGIDQHFGADVVTYGGFFDDEGHERPGRKKFFWSGRPAGGSKSYILDVSYYDPPGDGYSVGDLEITFPDGRIYERGDDARVTTAAVSSIEGEHVSISARLADNAGTLHDVALQFLSDDLGANAPS
ncbi:hypothetical protein H7J08_02400 [Mycobacterium frederiksbergense]|uniref:hypothetical protein n=1 Tax=Mycolicibacterium frederiksbergense TaxID=117567 RepID=UPI0021F2ADB0|nr:hypothetical protein [Mycolicibacterium frederiksbergense]MCV7043529.1 hypothetical protein [Mycolicibacterium frederiksbergense]